ncbi:MAG: hypothetical protein FWF01_01480 [Alphaproteobacteria bacterium]|nr:hypothetical protein [Alphaproteobacteria bacterium]
MAYEFNKAFCEKVLSDNKGKDGREKARGIICDAAFGAWWKGADVKQKAGCALAAVSYSLYSLFDNESLRGSNTQSAYIGLMRGWGVDMNKPGGHGLTMPMLMAMAGNDYHDMKDFLADASKAGKIDLRAESDDGLSAFGYAKLLGNTDAAQAMVEYVCNTEQASDNGNIPAGIKPNDNESFLNRAVEAIVKGMEKGNIN